MEVGIEFLSFRFDDGQALGLEVGHQFVVNQHRAFPGGFVRAVFEDLDGPLAVVQDREQTLDRIGGGRTDEAQPVLGAAAAEGLELRHQAKIIVLVFLDLCLALLELFLKFFQFPGLFLFLAGLFLFGGSLFFLRFSRFHFGFLPVQDFFIVCHG